MTAQPTPKHCPGLARQAVLLPLHQDKVPTVTYTPNQKGFAARLPDLAFLVALELPRLLVEVSPASLFCFLYWKLC